MYMQPRSEWWQFANYDGIVKVLLMLWMHFLTRPRLSLPKDFGMEDVLLEILSFRFHGLVCCRFWHSFMAYYEVPYSLRASFRELEGLEYHYMFFDGWLPWDIISYPTLLQSVAAFDPLGLVSFMRYLSHSLHIYFLIHWPLQTILVSAPGLEGPDLVLP